MPETTTTKKPSKANPTKPPAPEQPERAPEDAPKPDAAHPGEGVPQDLEMPSTRAIIIAVAAFTLLLIVLFLVGYIPSHIEETRVRREATDRASALPVVSFTSPANSGGTHDVTLPCNVQANQSTALYTRTNGYLKEWKYDIGMHVNKGDLMAVIDTPEVDAQLASSKATQAQNEATVTRAKADLELAQVTLRRYVDAQKTTPGSVTQEDVDTRKAAVDDADAALTQAKANVDAAKANVQQLQTQVDFEKVTAPFSGVVTKRNYDVGALLSPTNTAAGSEIFDLDQVDVLRVFVNVPQEYANDVSLNEHAKLRLRNFAAKSFDGVITYTAGALDPNTRTLRVQIDFSNKDGLLFEGEYGEIHLPVKDPETVSLIPTSAAVFNAQTKGLQVWVLDDLKKVKDPQNEKEMIQTGKVHLKPIKTARDFGTTIEVSSGLTDSEHVITNPSERLADGVTVQADELPPGSVLGGTPTTSPASKPTTMP